MKSRRHDAIRNLLGTSTVTSQGDLRRKLADFGFHVTQATLSRDIRELKLVKGPDGYALPAEDVDDADELPEIAGVMQDFCLEVRQAMNLLVVLTTMGGAQPVAANLDYEEWDEVVGTIAGDNTVLIVCPDVAQANTLKTRIEAYLD
jgi:transcriptional regulator of arginine metabolism